MQIYRASVEEVQKSMEAASTVEAEREEVPGLTAVAPVKQEREGRLVQEQERNLEKGAAQKEVLEKSERSTTGERYTSSRGPGRKL